ncbi:MAG: NAD(P)H-hydrate dehydratase [Aggregatilineales bacterium]
MHKIVTVAAMRKIEAAADAAGISYATMMENAGRVVAQRVAKHTAHIEQARVTIIAGPGNNGGDGLVAARVLAAETKSQIRVYLSRKRPENDPLLAGLVNNNVLIANAEDDQRFRVLQNMVASSDIVVDALFGIGVRLPLQGDAARILQIVNQTLNKLRAERPPIAITSPTAPADIQRPAVPLVLAVDCPSGLDCDTGQIDRNTIPADETITFIAAKPGLLTFPGANAVGALFVSDIGVPADLPELQHERLALIDGAYVRQRLPGRPLDSHKGTYGKALIIAGSPQYIGAPGLAALAAYRAGAGLVAVAAPPQVTQALAGHLLEAIWHSLDAPSDSDSERNLTFALKDSSAVLIGPGLGTASTTSALLDSVLNGPLPPTIIDADGLNLLASIPDWPKRIPAQTVLTPHPGEMARLTGLTVSQIQSNRLAVCRDSAAAWKAVVVLKGAHTVIADPQGDTAILPFKTDALATAGTGDVLAGTILGLLSQGASPFAAAAVGAYVNGLAAAVACQRLGSSRSVMAGDVAACLGQAFSLVESVPVVPE